jgi:hypothetical protein
MSSGIILLIEARAEARFALFLALLSDVKTTDDKIPMIAITTNNSISVKPLFLFIIYFPLDGGSAFGGKY